MEKYTVRFRTDTSTFYHNLNENEFQKLEYFLSMREENVLSLKNHNGHDLYIFKNNLIEVEVEERK